MAFNFGDIGDTMDGFDSEESQAGVVQEQEAPVPGYIQSPENQAALEQLDIVAQEEEYQQVMAQVDRRMTAANYYRMILDHDFFPNSGPEGHLVQSKVRRFVRDELEILLGMRVSSPKATGSTAQFTEEEVEVLKGLIARLKKPVEQKPQFKAVTQPAPQSQPQFKPIVAPQVVPKQAAPKPQAKPQTQSRAGVDPRIPPQYRNDPTAHIENGKVYVQARNRETGELLWVREGNKEATPFWKDVTPVAKPTGPIQPLPMPSIAQGNMISEQQAGANLQVLERMARIDPGMQKIAGGLIHSLTRED